MMDNKKLNTIMTILQYGLVGIGVLAFFLVIGGPNAEAEKSLRDEFMEGASLGLAINYTVYLIFGGLAVILLFFLLGLATNTKRTVMSIVGLIVAGVVFLIFWMGGTSDTNASLALREEVQVDQGTIGTTTAGIWTVLVCIAGGLVVVFWGALKFLRSK